MTPFVDIQQLFDTNRLPQGLAALPVLLYAPLGLALVLVRLFIGFHAYLVASVLSKTSLLRCLVLRVMCGVLGVLVTQTGSSKPPPMPLTPPRGGRERVTEGGERMMGEVVVANYSSTLDHVALELVLPNVMVSVWDLPPALTWLLGYRDMGALQGQDTLIGNVKKHCRESDVPLLAFPESATTNGRVGLLKYSVWPFSLDQPIRPVVIQISRPTLFSISPSVLGSRWWADIFWFLFTPYTLFNIRFLEAVAQTDDETPQEFARRVQTVMAAALDVSATTFTAADKLELLKKLNADRAIASRTEDGGGSGVGRSPPRPSPLDAMVDQVKDVLPHVPLDVIRRDLELTKDTDLTITNILEGRVEYVHTEPSVDAARSGASMEAVRSGSGRSGACGGCSGGAADKAAGGQQSGGNRTPLRPAPSSNASATFAKTSADRQLSFLERREAMLASARRRYLEKQAAGASGEGLSNPHSSPHTSS